MYLISFIDYKLSHLVILLFLFAQCTNSLIFTIVCLFHGYKLKYLKGAFLHLDSSLVCIPF